MDSANDAPMLVFFRQTPRDLLVRPPLASSLQHLESSFLLLSLSRYPHALIACASAIESALKAAFSLGENDRSMFRNLVKKARDAQSSKFLFSQSDTDEFADMRNKIIHFGFSPKDDEVSAQLLLKTGFRVLEGCYGAFFDFPLRSNGDSYGGLMVELSDQLDIAERVYARAIRESEARLAYCFIPLAHQIRWGIQRWMMSDWQCRLLEKEENEGWGALDAKYELKRESNIFDWDFDCPICGSRKELGCDLDQSKLKRGEVSIRRGYCYHCGLVIPLHCPFLGDELLADQIREAKSTILAEYGIDG